MKKIVLTIEGMKCGMCEAHINDTIRRMNPIKKVSSSHKKGESIVICDDDISAELIKEELERTGYRVLGIKEEPYHQKKWFR